MAYTRCSPMRCMDGLTSSWELCSESTPLLTSEPRTLTALLAYLGSESLSLTIADNTTVLGNTNPLDGFWSSLKQASTVLPHTKCSTPALHSLSSARLTIGSILTRTRLLSLLTPTEKSRPIVSLTKNSLTPFKLTKKTVTLSPRLRKPTGTYSLSTPPRSEHHRDLNLVPGTTLKLLFGSWVLSPTVLASGSTSSVTTTTTTSERTSLASAPRSSFS